MDKFLTNTSGEKFPDKTIQLYHYPTDLSTEERRKVVALVISLCCLRIYMSTLSTLSHLLLTMTFYDAGITISILQKKKIKTQTQKTFLRR